MVRHGLLVRVDPAPQGGAGIVLAVVFGLDVRRRSRLAPADRPALLGRRGEPFDASSAARRRSRRGVARLGGVLEEAAAAAASLLVVLLEALLLRVQPKGTPLASARGHFAARGGAGAGGQLPALHPAAHRAAGRRRRPGTAPRRPDGGRQRAGLLAPDPVVVTAVPVEHGQLALPARLDCAGLFLVVGAGRAFLAQVLVGHIVPVQLHAHYVLPHAERKQVEMDANEVKRRVCISVYVCKFRFFFI